FDGQSVLVVGMGNTGAEIALDLCESNVRATISLRGGVHIAPRDLFGIPIQIAATLATKVFPISVNDAIFPLVLDLALGYPARYGLKRPKEGILRQPPRSAKTPARHAGTLKKVDEAASTISLRVSAATE